MSAGGSGTIIMIESVGVRTDFKIINKSRIFFYWQFVCVMAWCVWTVDAPLTPVLYIYTSHSLKVSTPIYCCRWLHINIRYRLFPFLCSVGKGEVRHWCVQWRCWCTDQTAGNLSLQTGQSWVCCDGQGGHTTTAHTLFVTRLARKGRPVTLNKVGFCF